MNDASVSDMIQAVGEESSQKMIRDESMSDKERNSGAMELQRMWLRMHFCFTYEALEPMFENRLLGSPTTKLRPD